MIKKIFSLFAALTLSAGLWADEPAVTKIEIEGDMSVVGSELTFWVTVAGFSAEPMVTFEVKAGEGEYEQLQRNKFTPTATGDYTIKATAINRDDEKGIYEEAYKEVDFTIGTPAPVKGDQFEDTTSGLKFEITAVGDSNIVKVIANNYSDTTYTVPVTVKYNDVDYAVTEIGEKAFFKCESLQSVILSKGLLKIGAHAFDGCKSLQSVNLPEGLTEMGRDVFAECALTSITIPAGMTKIEKYIFYGCSSLESVTIPASVTEIGERTFYGCKSLQSISLPENLETIGEAAFEVSGLTSIIIPASVTELVYGAFLECTSLTSVTFLGNACQEAIGEDAFLNVGSPDTPTTLVLPDNWTGSKPVDSETAWYGGYFKLGATALPIIGDGVKGNKFLHNGQLIIRKNGKHFNAVGAEL